MEFPFEFPSKVSAMNGDTIESDILLQIQVMDKVNINESPHLHCYSALVNNGDIMKPVIELKEG